MAGGNPGSDVPPRPVTVHKLDALGREVWRYPGHLVAETDDTRTLEAFFDRQDGDLGGLPLRRGDRFLETFYSNRWYSVFAISEPGAGRFKGWYCNLSRPARFEIADIFAEDLELDLIVFPDGRDVVLDVEEYEALNLGGEERAQVDRALRELRELARGRQPPFEAADAPGPSS
jgi:hypothetical protein